MARASRYRSFSLPGISTIFFEAIVYPPLPSKSYLRTPPDYSSQFVRLDPGIARADQLDATGNACVNR